MTHGRRNHPGDRERAGWGQFWLTLVAICVLLMTVGSVLQMYLG